MKHSDVHNLMADYLEGDLELDQRALFDAHLDDCPDCAEDVAGMRGTISLLHSLPDPVVPEEMSGQIMRRVRSGEMYPAWRDALRAIFAPLLEPRILAPVSAGVLVIGLVLGSSEFLEVRRVGPETTPALASTTGGPNSTGALASTAENSPRFVLIQNAAQRAPAAGFRPTPKQEMIALSTLMANSSPLGEIKFNVGPLPLLAARPEHDHMQKQSQYELVSVRPDDSASRAMVRMPSNSSSALERARQPSAEDWLVRIQDDPAGFASRLAFASLAEQELWVQHLAKVARQNNELNEVVASLRSSPSRGARLLADDFEAAGGTGEFR